jgi:cupin 2 domain-containing protein
MQIGNFLSETHLPIAGECFDEILRHKNLVVERIVSVSIVVPIEYAQEQDEWVMLMQGEATLIVAGQTMRLKAGDYIFLPAGTAHTLQSTSHGAVWLAVHLYPEQANL